MTFITRLRCAPLTRPLRPQICALREDESRALRLRSEAEAPFRVFRLTLYGSAVVSGGVGLLVNLTQVIGAVLGRPDALTVRDVAKNVGIDVAAVAVFGYLAFGEWKARERQIERLTRESRLAALTVQMTTGKTIKVGQLRGFARAVKNAHPAAENVAVFKVLEAEAFREQLTAAGVFIIEAPIYGEEVLEDREPSEEDKRWRGKAIRLEDWRSWFEDQTKDSAVASDAGLYVSLRLDGRVRASGRGSPPWFRIANKLPPIEGIWKGFGDGFDGPVY